uniref:hypothetical protein n=1 Tax=Shewanella sp. TaxID=50422 RepID=UPI0040475270
MTSRNYLATWNNYPENWVELLDKFYNAGRIKYLIGGAETAPTTGTPHIQMHIDLTNSSTMSALHKRLNKCDINLSLKPADSALHSENNRKYCKKDCKFNEWGTPPSQGKRNDLNDFMECIAANPKKRRLEIMEEFPTVYAKYPRFANEYRLLKIQHDIIEGELHHHMTWVHGPPGCGKSRPYQEAGAYSKPCNKWWDGYDGEDLVLIEDVDHTTAKHMGHILKIWTDRYPFYVDIKGATIKIRPKKVVVTSNYHPDELFHDSQMQEALGRRFKIINMDSDFEGIS